MLCLTISLMFRVKLFFSFCWTKYDTNSIYECLCGPPNFTRVFMVGLADIFTHVEVALKQGSQTRGPRAD